MIVSLVLFEIFVGGKSEAGRGAIDQLTYPGPVMPVYVFLPRFGSREAVVKVEAGEQRAFKASGAIVSHKCEFVFRLLGRFFGQHFNLLPVSFKCFFQ